LLPSTDKEAAKRSAVPGLAKDSGGLSDAQQRSNFSLSSASLMSASKGVRQSRLADERIRRFLSRMATPPRRRSLSWKMQEDIEGNGSKHQQSYDDASDPRHKSSKPL
jgi:hypothetical protein